MSYMEQQMQQQMEGGSWHELEQAYDEAMVNVNSMSAALTDILPLIEETHPEIYIKYMGIVDTNEIKD